MQPQNDEVEIARMRVLRARQELNGTVDEVLSRLKPMEMASNALSRVAGRHADWMSTALTLYRFRGTAMSVVGGLAALKARKEVKCKEGGNTAGNGVSRMAQDLKDGVGQAREKVRTATNAGVQKLSEVGGKVKEKAAASGTKGGNRLVEGIRENPLAAIAGGLAAGVLIAALLSRRSGADGTASSLDRLRTKASDTAREAAQNIGARLDEMGINRENAREAVAKAKEAARGAKSQVTQLARETLSKTKGRD